MMEHVTGKTPDISEYCDFDIYELVWYQSGLHPKCNDENRTLGQLLGVSHRFVSDICYWILTKLVRVIAETTVKHVTIYDMLDDKTAAQVGNFNTDIIEQSDDTKCWIQYEGGGFTLKYEYDLQQWDPAYGDNDPILEEYGAANGGTPLAHAEDLN